MVEVLPEKHVRKTPASILRENVCCCYEKDERVQNTHLNV
jgi:hypothetical protein